VRGPAAPVLRPDIAAALAGEDLFDFARRSVAEAPPTAIYRAREGRTTLRVELGERGYFLKYHRGIGWREIIKNLLQARLPVLGAATELRALQALQRAGVPTMNVAAYAARGWNPAHRESLLLTDALDRTISLEALCATWPQQPPPLALRVALLRTVAGTTRRMHACGLNHRDLYLCHFLVAASSLDSPPLQLHLIDLHRAQLRRRTPRRWLIKDLAGLWFSAMDIGLTRRDQLRFLRGYCTEGLRHALGADAAFWSAVRARAIRQYQREYGKPPPAASLRC